MLESIGQNFDVVTSAYLQQDFLICAIGIVCKISYMTLLMLRLRENLRRSKPANNSKSWSVAGDA